LLSNEPLNDRISATSVTISNTHPPTPRQHGLQHRRRPGVNARLRCSIARSCASNSAGRVRPFRPGLLRGLSNNRTVMRARRTLRETTGSSVGWSAIVVVFSATARSMPARLMSMSMSMPVAGDGVAGGRSGVVVRPAGTGGRAPTAVYGSTWVQCPAALVAREVLAGVADVTAEHGAIKVCGFPAPRPARGGTRRAIPAW